MYTLIIMFLMICLRSQIQGIWATILVFLKKTMNRIIQKDNDMLLEAKEQCTPKEYSVFCQCGIRIYLQNQLQ